MTIAIIQARLTSSRLPNKVLMQLGKYTAIELMYERVKRARSLSNIVFAIPENAANDMLADYIETTLKAPLIRGSEDDVLGRYVKVSECFPHDSYVRLTADCPLICPEIIDLIAEKGNAERLDYCSNTNPPTFPDGFDSEFITYDLLRWLDRNVESIDLREHVTLGLNSFNLDKLEIRTGNLVCQLRDYSKIRMTLDYPEDFLVLKAIIENDRISPLTGKLKDFVEIYERNLLQKLNGKYVTPREAHLKQD